MNAVQKEKLLKDFEVPEEISPEKLKLGWEIARLKRQIIYVDYALIILKLKYHKNIADEVRSFGYTLPDFEDPNYRNALKAIESLDNDRMEQLQKLILEFKSMK